MDIITEIADILCDTVVIYAKNTHDEDIISKKGLDKTIYPSIHTRQEDRNDYGRNKRSQIKKSD